MAMKPALKDALPRVTRHLVDATERYNECVGKRCFQLVMNELHAASHSCTVGSTMSKVSPESSVDVPESQMTKEQQLILPGISRSECPSDATYLPEESKCVVPGRS